GHGLHGDWTQNTLAVVDAAVEEHLQDDSKVIDIGVHAAPRMSELPQVQAVRSVAIQLLLRLCKRIALYPGGVRERTLAETQAALLHFQRLEEFTLFELGQRRLRDTFDDLRGQKCAHAGILERGARLKQERRGHRALDKIAERRMGLAQLDILRQHVRQARG